MGFQETLRRLARIDEEFVADRAGLAREYLSPTGHDRIGRGAAGCGARSC